jgi:NAD(P)-dependent dehydrogenase (short-subunit alcohol dehydrogenase family)
VVALSGCDLASQEGVMRCAALTKEALRTHRGVEALDVLVHNSGVSWGEPLATFSEKGWDKVSKNKSTDLQFG